MDKGATVMASRKLGVPATSVVEEIDPTMVYAKLVEASTVWEEIVVEATELVKLVVVNATTDVEIVNSILSRV